MGGALNIIALVAFLAFLMVGVAVATIGLRGRMALVEPRCARCGQRIGRGEYERSGRCPECGLDLRAASAIRYFRRRRRVGLATTGLAIAFLAPIAPIALAFARSQGAGSGPVSGTPAALAAQLRAANWDTGLAILFELDRQRTAGLVAPQDYDAIVGAIIAWQATLKDQSVTVPATELLAAARAAQRLDDEHVRRMGAAVFPDEGVFVPAKVRANRPFTVELPWLEGRGTFERIVKIHGVSEGDVTLSGPIERPMPAQITLAAGQHRLKVDVEIGYRIVTSSPGGSGPNDPPLASLRQTLEIPVEAVPEDAPPLLPLVRAADDPAAARAIAEKACVVRRVALDRDSSDGSCVVRVDCDLGAGPPPMTLCWRVIARIAGREIPLGDVKITSVDGGWSSSGSGRYAASCECPADDAPVEIVFRPDPIAAEGDPHVKRVWADEVVVRDPPVVRNTAAKARPNS